MITLIAVVLIVMLLLYVVQLLPLDGRVTLALQVLILLFAVLWLVSFAGFR